MDTMGKLIFLSKKHNGGYGDRLVGFSSAITIGRILHMNVSSIWEEDFVSICNKSHQFSSLPIEYIDINCYNKKSHPVLEHENILEVWKGKTIVFQANQPVDILLWKNPYLQHILTDIPYEQYAIQSFKEIFTKYIELNDILQEYTDIYEYGIQIRCGDTYCMPHSLAQQYIPEKLFTEFAKSVKQYLQTNGIRGRVYLTSDAHILYSVFKSLSDTTIQFVYWERSQDIHFDSYNSQNKYMEIVRDHICLQHCKRILTSIRSNFGTTAAYCSPFCKELIFFSSTWDEPLNITYKNFNIDTYSDTSTLVLKEYLTHLL